MRDRRGLLIGVGVLALGLAAAGRATIYRTIAADEAGLVFDGGGDPFPDDPARVAAIRAAGRRIRPLHAAKVPPGPGDWLAKHQEPGQTFEEYRAGSPNHPTSLRTTIYLEPWGDFDEGQAEVLRRTGEVLEAFFGVPVRTRPGRSLETVPNEARPHHPERGDRRLLTAYVLSELQLDRPEDAVAVIALTTPDLTPSGRGSWVFGQASLSDRVGACSLYRQGDPRREFTLVLRRTLKTTLHETGHILGIPHCAAYECAMNGSSHREEADSRPLWFCPEDEMKVWLACGLDPEERYGRLAGLAASFGLDEEARFWDASRRAFASAGAAGRGGPSERRR